ncbi:hypothetical protein M514_21384 [Trichuris suis]|uniref:Uncharacterized protein n=1 Tax=Trichuris suis TaxID=68888 RepID=A0A085NA58_9BILA|nr:hypothetical protein M514_21384 [Trichuris suis]
MLQNNLLHELTSSEFLSKLKLSRQNIGPKLVSNSSRNASRKFSVSSMLPFQLADNPRSASSDDGLTQEGNDAGAVDVNSKDDVPRAT